MIKKILEKRERDNCCFVLGGAAFLACVLLLLLLLLIQIICPYSFALRHGDDDGSNKHLDITVLLKCENW